MPIQRKGFKLNNRITSYNVCYTKLLRPIEQLPPDWRDSGINIKEISEEEFMTYALIHCRSTGLPDDGIPYVADNNQVLYARPGWRFFMALIRNNFV